MKKLKADPVKTVLVITVGFLVVYFFSKWQWAFYVALIVGITGALSGYLANRIDFLWTKLAWLLSMIIPNILLSLVFFLLLTPIAWLSRLFGNPDPLDLKNTNASLFKETNKQFEKTSFEKPW